MPQDVGPWTRYQNAAPAPSPEEEGPWTRYQQQGAPTQDAVAASEPVDSRNQIQKAFDNLTTVTPEQEQGHSWPVNRAQEFGAGVMQLATPLIHPLKTAETMGQNAERGLELNPSAPKPASAPSQPWAQTAGNLAGGAVLGGLGEEGAGLIAKIPTKARAGALFNEVDQAAHGQPVTLTRAMQPLERAQQLSATGHGTVTALDNLYKRINTVNPLDYSEARDYASALSRLTGQDKMVASPSLAAQAKLLSQKFNQDIGDTATAAGKGPEYTKAMRDYRIASKVGDAKDALVKGVKKAAIPTVLGATGYGAYKAFHGQ